MAVAFTTRSKASVYLKGIWIQSILAEGIVLLAEFLIIAAEGVCVYRFAYITFFPLFLLTDVLVLSPLKAGHAYFYKTAASDKSKTKASLLFHFYHHGYFRCIGWRLQLWIRRIALYIPLCLPSAFFIYIGKTVTSETIGMVAFAFSLIFLLIALVTTEILLFRYIPAVYLLTRVTSAKRAFLISKRLSKGNTGSWVQLHLDYAGWCFSLILLIPFFYISPLYQTARAATVKELFLGISAEICEQPLQRGKNRGRIRSKF